jgi:hypothetical protein
MKGGIFSVKMPLSSIGSGVEQLWNRYRGSALATRLDGERERAGHLRSQGGAAVLIFDIRFSRFDWRLS